MRNLSNLSAAQGRLWRNCRKSGTQNSRAPRGTGCEPRINMRGACFVYLEQSAIFYPEISVTKNAHVCCH